MKQDALENAFPELGLKVQDGDNGKAPSSEELRARLYLAEVGAEPNTTMEAASRMASEQSSTE